MFNVVSTFFNSDEFMPHGHCFLWQNDILWLHILSDAGIVAAYFSIPFLLIYFIRNRKDIPLQIVFLLFGAFILLCGTTHLLSIWVLWHPDYAVEGVIKAMTALVSLTTLVVLIKLMPKALQLPSPRQLKQLNEELKTANLNLEMLHQQTEASGQARLRAVFDNVSDILATVNAEGIIENTNKASETILGYKVHELAGVNLSKILPDLHSDTHNFMNTIQTIAAGTTEETIALRRDGSSLSVELSINAFMLDNQHYFSVFIRDITLSKKLEADTRLLSSIVTSSEDVIMSRTLSGTITSWNRAAEHLLGFSAEEAIGKHISLIIPSANMEEEKHIIRELMQGKALEHFETQRKTKDGSIIDISLTVSPIYNKKGEIIGASKIARDISSKKITEQKLLQYMNDLERSNKELDDFAYIASHDLKEPLRGLYNNALFLTEDYENTIDEHGITRLKRMNYLCQRMEKLINDLLYFSRLGRQQLAIFKTNVPEIIQDIQEMMENTLEENNARIVIEEGIPEIICDKIRITEVFRNLISNGIKYNNSPEKIITIGCKHNFQGHACVFYVQDNGIGIDQQFHEDIFRIFKRLNEEDDDRKGTGVGLTFVRKIIERHGGTIWLKSELGKATIFYFIIGKKVY